jgi:hypothetical protein
LVVSGPLKKKADWEWSVECTKMQTSYFWLSLDCLPEESCSLQPRNYERQSELSNTSQWPSRVHSAQKWEIDHGRVANTLSNSQINLLEDCFQLQ